MSLESAVESSQVTETPVVSRGPHPAPDGPGGRVSQSESEVHNWLLTAIRYVVLVVTMAIWTVLGFFVWVPLLFRAILLLSGAVLYSSLVNRETARAEARLRHAIGFFPSGYIHISNAIRGQQSKDDDDDDESSLHWVRVVFHVAAELFISGVFWYLLGTIVNAWDLPSADAVANHWGAVVRYFTSLVK